MLSMTTGKFKLFDVASADGPVPVMTVYLRCEGWCCRGPSAFFTSPCAKLTVLARFGHRD